MVYRTSFLAASHYRHAYLKSNEMFVGGLRQSTLSKLSVVGSCGFLTFCPAGRHRGLGEHMFNRACSAFLFPSFLFSSRSITFSTLSSFLSSSFWVHCPLFFYFPISYSFTLPLLHDPGHLERAAKEPEGAQDVARPAGERCNTGSGD